MSDRQPSHSSEPLVWLLMGNRAGDNSQVLGLGEALGWPLVEKHFSTRATRSSSTCPSAPTC
ncbi:MAG: hypothetical protein R3E53_11240 [Myxococcota bacterium]